DCPCGCTASAGSKNRWGGRSAQCRLVFPPPITCINCEADPLVRGRRPGRPLAFGRKLIPNEERVRGDPRGPGGPPHWISAELHHFAKLSGIEAFNPRTLSPRAARLSRLESRLAARIGRPTA